MYLYWKNSECIKKGLIHHVAEKTVLYRGMQKKYPKKFSSGSYTQFARRSVWFWGFQVCYLKALYNHNIQDVGFPFCCATAVFAKELWYGRTLMWVCELASLRTAGGIWWCLKQMFRFQELLQRKLAHFGRNGKEIGWRVLPWRTAVVFLFFHLLFQYFLLMATFWNKQKQLRCNKMFFTFLCT